MSFPKDEASFHCPFKNGFGICLYGRRCFRHRPKIHPTLPVVGQTWDAPLELANFIAIPQENFDVGAPGLFANELCADCQLLVWRQPKKWLDHPKAQSLKELKTLDVQRSHLGLSKHWRLTR